jgi:hypothetical protein
VDTRRWSRRRIALLGPDLFDGRRLCGDIAHRPRVQHRKESATPLVDREPPCERSNSPGIPGVIAVIRGRLAASGASAMPHACTVRPGGFRYGGASSLSPSESGAATRCPLGKDSVPVNPGWRIDRATRLSVAGAARNLTPERGPTSSSTARRSWCSLSIRPVEREHVPHVGPAQPRHHLVRLSSQRRQPAVPPDQAVMIMPRRRTAQVADAISLGWRALRSSSSVPRSELIHQPVPG